MLEEPDFAKQSFIRMCDLFRKCKLLQENEVDEIIHEYGTFLRNTVAKDPAFSKFDIHNEAHRLDELYYAALSDKPHYKNLWEKVIGKALVLSHGQATVERGFSQNKEVTEYNQVTESLMARRSIKDHINFVGGRSKFLITDGLLKNVRDANQKYRLMLEEQKKAKSSEGQKRKHMQDEIDQIRKRRKEMEELRITLDTEGKKIILNCKTNDIIEMTKAKGLLAKAQEEEEKLRSLDEELERKISVFNNS